MIMALRMSVQHSVVLFMKSTHDSSQPMRFVSCKLTLWNELLAFVNMMLYFIHAIYVKCRVALTTYNIPSVCCYENLIFSSLLSIIVQQSENDIKIKERIDRKNLR
jgi:hypothetical protein